VGTVKIFWRFVTAAWTEQLTTCELKILAGTEMLLFNWLKEKEFFCAHILVAGRYGCAQ
jgi:hypothetical protein